jgi:hypothetical protein
MSIRLFASTSPATAAFSPQRQRVPGKPHGGGEDDQAVEGKSTGAARLQGEGAANVAQAASAVMWRRRERRLSVRVEKKREDEKIREGGEEGWKIRESVSTASIPMLSSQPIRA